MEQGIKGISVVWYRESEGIRGISVLWNRESEGLVCYGTGNQRD